MTNQLTIRQVKNLVGKLKKTIKKLVRAISHQIYLEECKNKGIFPRALYVAKLIKSGELK